MKETKTYKKMVGLPVNNFPTQIIVHHSGGTNANPLEDTSHHTAQIMETYHLSLGWDGLGYHYVIHKDGEVWKGRPEHRNGAHTRGYNTSSIGICLSGNFDATLPTEQQKASLKSLLLDIKTRHSIQSIVPHRKYANKSCFGRNLADDWASDLLKKSSLDDFTSKELLNELLTRI